MEYPETNGEVQEVRVNAEFILEMDINLSKKQLNDIFKSYLKKTFPKDMFVKLGSINIKEEREIYNGY